MFFYFFLLVLFFKFFIDFSLLVLENSINLSREPNDRITNIRKMYLHETKIRIRYGETDQMGYVYYGNYAQFFEIGRVEMLRSLGVSYRSLEDNGIMLPVVDYSVKYIKPALYDDLITIRTMISEVPSVKIKFDYEILNESGDLLTTAKTTLVFVKKENMKPTFSPQELVKELEGKLLKNSL